MTKDELEELIANDRFASAARDMFAAHALQGILSRAMMSEEPEQVANEAYGFANAMMRRRVAP